MCVSSALVELQFCICSVSSALVELESCICSVSSALVELQSRKKRRVKFNEIEEECEFQNETEDKVKWEERDLKGL